MTLEQLLRIYSDNQCNKVYVKKLSPNDNSKNQVYLGGSFEVLNVLPIKDIVSDNSGDWARMRFKSRIEFYWASAEGNLLLAPSAQLILYPKYPEVRFSGFLKGSEEAPSELMSSRIEGRLLFFGVTSSGTIIGNVVAPDSDIAREFNELKELPTVGIFKELTLQDGRVHLESRKELLEQLKRIHLLGWINASRLNSERRLLPCVSSNCGGYTLEAELGITPNGYSEPDYLGWEVKQFNVKDFKKWNSSIVTLMTPEPTHGFYVNAGVEAFIQKYGYMDKRGREARMNFGGIHKYEVIHASTKLKLITEGMDAASYKITSTDGYIGLIDDKDNIAASWSFSSLLKHWNRKHANACYVPSMKRRDLILYPYSGQQYLYGNTVMLGEGTDFSLLLQQIAKGNIYYDPGIKLELEIPAVRKQHIKRRSQFRIKAAHIQSLYRNFEIIDVATYR